MTFLIVPKVMMNMRLGKGLSNVENKMTRTAAHDLFKTRNGKSCES